MTKGPACCLFAVIATFTYFQIVVNAEVEADGRQSWTHKDTASNEIQKNRNVISPRMEFDEWTPLGRGDPLKNDPTFDYLPPVLDKVHYWKPSPPVNRVVHSSTVAPIPSQTISYNRRFFLTDFSKKEPTGYVPYNTHKRPQVTSVGGYHYPMPKTPLPMLTPPPYQRPTTVVTTTVEPMDMSLADVGNSAAESKQPPTVRAPAPPVPGIRPILSHSVIKALLENEVDRTTVTTSAISTTSMTTTSTTSTTTTTTVAPPTTDPFFSHYKQSSVTGRPMYLIIQGHSKVKTYGLVNKPDDLSSAHSADTALQDHNHIGNRPDEQMNRRKRNNAP